MTNNPESRPANPQHQARAYAPTPGQGGLTGPGGAKGRRALAAVLVALGSALAYANILGHGFVWDDHLLIAGNPAIREWSDLVKAFGRPVWFPLAPHGTLLASYYRPLEALAYTSIYLLGGLQPWVYHLASVLFHALTAVALMLLTEELTESLAAGFVAALLFAVYPLHTEAVNWIVALPVIECAFFYLASVYCWARWRKTQAGGSGIRFWLLGACGAFLLALLADEMAITLPLALLLFERFRGNEGQNRIWDPAPGASAAGKVAKDAGLSHSKLDAASIPARAGSRKPAATTIWLKFSGPGAVGGTLAVYLGLRDWALGGLRPGQNGHVLTSWQYFLSDLALLGSYFQKTFLPIHLNAYYVFQPTSSLGEPAVILGAAWAIVCLGILLVAKRVSVPLGAASATWLRPALFGLVWIPITLIPALAIRQVGYNVFAERYLYLPSAGACLVGAGLLCGLYARPARSAKWIAAALALALVAAFAFQTVRRNGVWKDDFTLDRQTILDSPNAAPIYSDLGHAYYQRGEYAEALAAGREALDAAQRDYRQNPRFVSDAYAGMGTAELALRRGAQAESDFHHALAAYPNADAYLNLGVIAFQRGDYRSTAALSKQAIRASPTYGLAYNNAGAGLLAMGQVADAMPYLEKAVELEPRYTQARINLALAYQKSGEIPAAIRQVRAVLGYDPKNQAAYQLLVEFLKIPVGPAAQPPGKN